MDSKERYSHKEVYDTTTSKDNFQFSETEETHHSINNPDLIVGRYLIYDSRTRRCYARNNSSIEITTPRDGNHISKMVDAILGCASPNSVKEVIGRSLLSRPRIPSPEPSLIPPPPPYPPSVVSVFPPNSPPPYLLESPLTPKEPRQAMQATPISTPRQRNQNILTDNNSPPYSPFPDSYFAQFDVLSPPVSISPISNSYYSDDSELLYASAYNSPTTPRKNK
ncbi:hypothetical protein RhiirA5_477660 [Rhizophagus irregularis]|jgi:hypothetical protein|uniref:Uncharacterized protein n=2 Tax=Rhizophagus irregularis TaxID=588596 RepID=A0A2I1H036_9GLOM|nr:hypothetical protein GLOIN_2v1722435 [Rhizophagus irregularis DAOM 181602=DAOM 197198]PKC08288.1 hypothetical protein RhiirA5_477660 [Rhizophagus irregularis]RGB36957.1 hypothetical protein C1646_757448 [Rhizophagus diaphanus] [Rhizophagus sp. MUCL 43196]PKK77619.1 hypothetical protein RhiirC2_731590 [Rhizophagus irregularis]PKY20110.1 hypothetical protein RhiirB3_496773 [Rhizophagus irregularis]PKY52246.1 hypothetical protein RhiirA4_20486 [Rhizophagus irregularis]|eukprot:XP_025166223.1 hypothetical protein GLOIN_2v1722435 [Rhizophagus irregularis DAOM 181602=DAOM 197198]